MEISVSPVTQETVARYCEIPSSVEVNARLEVELLADGYKGIIFKEKAVEKPYIKDYGGYDGFLKWTQEFDTRQWVIFLLKDGKKSVGGLTVACRTQGLWMLAGRNDLVCVWDIRVHPDYQHRGYGTRLFEKAIEWSKSERYKQLCVETQNINVPACRFYLKQGCTLGGVNRYAYRADPRVADETQLVWYLDL